jgi:hypothetical protein
MTAACERLKSFAHAMALLITFGLAIRMLTETDLHESLVAEVESHRCSQIDNIL